MQVQPIFHEVDAMPLDRVTDDHDRFAFDILPDGFLSRVDNLFDVMSVNSIDIPTECPPFILERLLSKKFFIEVGGALPIAIQKDNQIVEFVMPRKHCRFPDRTFVALAVADNGVILPRLVIAFRRISRAARHAEPDTQRTARKINARNAELTVAAEASVVAAELIQFTVVNPTEIGKNRIQHDAGMVFAEKQSITLRPFGIAPIDVHSIVIQRGQNFGAGEGTRYMSEARFDAHLKHAQFQLTRFFIQHIKINFLHPHKLMV